MTLSPTAHRGGPRVAIGLDLGATKIAGGVVAADGGVVGRIEPVPTPGADQEATVSTLVGFVERLRLQHPGVEAVGVGAAGLIDWPEGRIRTAPYSSYRSFPLRRILQEATGLPTVVDNDANAAAWGESQVGNRASYMAFLTVGTGVGGGLILAGRPYRGNTGIGAEVGHLVVDPYGDHECGCGNIGCLEALASGTALGRYGRDAAAAEPDGRLAKLAGGADRVTGETVFAAATGKDPDPVACALFERLGRWLGIGIASLVNIFDFELIAVGGGVAAAAGDMLLAPARKSFERFVTARAYRRLPPIVPARLGADATWIGAGMLAHDHLGELRLNENVPHDASAPMV